MSRLGAVEEFKRHDEAGEAFASLSVVQRDPDSVEVSCVADARLVGVGFTKCL